MVFLKFKTQNLKKGMWCKFETLPQTSPGQRLSIDVAVFKIRSFPSNNGLCKFNEMRKIRKVKFNANSWRQWSKCGKSKNVKWKRYLTRVCYQSTKQIKQLPGPQSCHEIAPFRCFFRLSSPLIIHESKNFKFKIFFFDENNPPFVKNALKVS